MPERGVAVDPSCIRRWVQTYPFDLNKRCRPHLKATNKSYRTDETYIKVKGEDKYLDRAVDSTGQTIDFLLTAKRDAAAAKHFFRKALSSPGNPAPRVINASTWIRTRHARRRWKRSSGSKPIFANVTRSDRTQEPGYSIVESVCAIIVRPAGADR